MRFSPDGSALFAIEDTSTPGAGPFSGGIVSVFDTATGKVRWKKTFDSFVDYVRFSPDSRTVSISYSATISFFNNKTGTLLRTIQKVDLEVFSPDNKTLALTTEKSVQLWNISDLLS